MIARVPRAVVETYVLADKQRREQPFVSSDWPPVDEKARLDYLTYWVGAEIVNRSAELLGYSLWHPWLSGLIYRWRIRKLRKIMHQILGNGVMIWNLNTWYRVWRTISRNETKRDRAIVWTRRKLRRSDPLLKKYHGSQKRAIAPEPQPDKTVSNQG